jgi:hypothetical protein
MLFAQHFAALVDNFAQQRFAFLRPALIHQDHRQVADHCQGLAELIRVLPGNHDSAAQILLGLRHVSLELKNQREVIQRMRQFHVLAGRELLMDRQGLAQMRLGVRHQAALALDVGELPQHACRLQGPPAIRLLQR